MDPSGTNGSSDSITTGMGCPCTFACLNISDSSLCGYIDLMEGLRDTSASDLEFSSRGRGTDSGGPSKSRTV